MLYCSLTLTSCVDVNVSISYCLKILHSTTCTDQSDKFKTAKSCDYHACLIYN